MQRSFSIHIDRIDVENGFAVVAPIQQSFDALKAKRIFSATRKFRSNHYSTLNEKHSSVMNLLGMTEERIMGRSLKFPKSRKQKTHGGEVALGAKMQSRIAFVIGRVDVHFRLQQQQHGVLMTVETGEV